MWKLSCFCISCCSWSNRLITKNVLNLIQSFGNETEEIRDNIIKEHKMHVLKYISSVVTDVYVSFNIYNIIFFLSVKLNSLINFS